MSSFAGVYRGIISGLANSIYWLMWIVPLIAVIVTAIIVYRNKKIFVYPVRIFRVRENGKVLESNYKGGFISRKNSSPFFRIKMSWLPWKYKDLTTTPNPAYMDEQNRVYLKQIGVNSFVQLRRYFDDKGNVHFTPVESDVEYGAILSIQRIRQLTSGNDKWKTIGAIGAIVLIFAAAIIAWAFLMNAKCPALG